MNRENLEIAKQEMPRKPPWLLPAIRAQGATLVLGVVVLTLLCGVAFPLVLGGAARLLWPDQADGSLVRQNGVVVGAEFIGQSFTGPGYFHPRPSAAGSGYDATSSGGTNLGPSHPKLWNGTPDDPATHDVDETFVGIAQLAKDYRQINGLPPDAEVPVDAVTRSGSGLDPHISPANATLQAKRVAHARGLQQDRVLRLIADNVQGRQFGLLGEPRVSVLALNRALNSGQAPSANAPTTIGAESFAFRWLEYAAFLALVIGLAWPVGRFLARVFERQRTFLDPVLVPIERVIHRMMHVRPDQEMSGGVYLLSFTLFGLLGTAVLLLVLVLQSFLPGGPETRFLSTPMTPHLAVNTAVSFATTTTWQAYGGETTMRYLTQVLGLTAQGFLAGAAGLAVGVAFIRGFARERSATVGNFWVDLVRALLWVLLPLALVIGLVLVWQGVPLNLSAYTDVHTVEGAQQTIAQGPIAVLEAIKNLGTNGGGFFNANAAHPYANPTPLTNFLALLAIAVLPAALTITFGQMAGHPRAGWLLLAVMVVLFVGGLAICDAAESANAPRLAALHVAGGNMEGKEVRFGIHGSVLTALVTSNGATGSYNAMHGSFQPLSILVLLLNMLIGELIFGGLGTGLFSMVMTALIAVFIGGLMIGRTPEYLGKKVGIGEAKLVALYALVGPAVVLSLTGLAVATQAGLAGLVTNSGARGFSEILFAYASCAANNGQNMAGLNANTPFYNGTTVIAMAAGRFALAGLAIAVAQRFAAQGKRPVAAGSLPSDNLTFALLVLGAILLLGAVSFLPALALGPIVEFLGS